MGFFGNLKKSFSKSGLMKNAAQQVQSGDLASAVKSIYAYHKSDKEFMSIHEHFSSSEADIEKIIKAIMASGFGGTIRGHYVPVSAVLFHDTFAYMLRAQNGQVEKGKAYFQVQDYFATGEIIFKPEHEFH